MKIHLSQNRAHRRFGAGLVLLGIVCAQVANAAPPQGKVKRPGAAVQPAEDLRARASRKPARSVVQQPLTKDALNVGGPRPDLQAFVNTGRTVSLGQTGTYVLRLKTDSQATAYRIANSREELKTAQWKAFEEYPTFTPNARFPVRMVAQIGKPLGNASHPVQGPHRESLPAEANHGSLRHLAEDPKVRSWNTPYGGNYAGVSGTLNFALNGLANDTEQIQLSQLKVCGDSFRYDQAPSVTKEGPGTFVVSGSGVFAHSRNSCRITASIIGDGGNFDAGVAYQYDDTDESFSVANKPALRVTNTGAFAYRPKFTLTTAGPGNCTKGTDNSGRLYFEVTSGALPGSCTFTAPELLVPPDMRMQGLHWRVEEYRAGPSGSFHCSVRSSYPRNESRFWYQMVAPERSDYFVNTTAANPLLPGNVTPEVTADLSYPAPRQWIPPLRARISCGVYIGQNAQGNIAFDRLRLVLDHVDYRAPPGLPVGTEHQPQ